MPASLICFALPMWWFNYRSRNPDVSVLFPAVHSKLRADQACSPCMVGVSLKELVEKFWADILQYEYCAGRAVCKYHLSQFRSSSPVHHRSQQKKGLIYVDNHLKRYSRAPTTAIFLHTVLERSAICCRPLVTPPHILLGRTKRIPLASAPKAIR